MNKNRKKQLEYLKKLRGEHVGKAEDILEMVADDTLDGRVRTELAKAYTAEVNADTELMKIIAAEQTAIEETPKNFAQLALEAIRTIVPVVTTAVTIAAYSKWQKQILLFEETGRVTSTPGRTLRYPQPKI